MELKKTESSQLPKVPASQIVPVKDAQNMLTSTQKEKKPIRPPLEPLSLMQSFLDSSSSCSVTSKQIDLHRKKPIGLKGQLEVTESLMSKRPSMFEHLGANDKEGHVCSSSKY